MELTHPLKGFNKSDRPLCLQLPFQICASVLVAHIESSLKPKGRRVFKPRPSRACNTCRLRKARYSLAQSENLYTRCELDDIECILSPIQRRKGRKDETFANCFTWNANWKALKRSEFTLKSSHQRLDQRQTRY